MSGALPLTETPDGLVLTVRVTPKSSKEALEAVRIESDGPGAPLAAVTE